MKMKRAEDKPKYIKRAPEQSIKVKQQSIKLTATAGAKALAKELEGGEKMQDAAITAYLLSKPIGEGVKKGTALAKEKAKIAREKQMKRKEQRMSKKEQNDRKDKSRGEKGSDKQTHDKKSKSSSKHKNTDKKQKKQHKRGIRKLAYKMQKVLLMKSNGNRENETSIWNTLLIQRIAIPALVYLALGLILVALIALPVMAVIAIIYNSPFAIFFPPLESGDTVLSVTSAYMAEFDREVNELAVNHTGYDRGQVVYVDYEGAASSPTNYYDILAVYMVKHGIGDTATIINETSKGWIETVADDMCDYTTSSGTEIIQNEDGSEKSQTVLYINITLKDFRDMISVYGFDDEQVKLLEQMMSPESLAMLGYDDNLEVGQSSISHAETQQILSAITDEKQRKVCSFALSKVGYPYSQTYRDSGDYFDCSSLAFYAWKYAGVNISFGGVTTAAAEAQGLEEAGKTVAYEELQPGDLIFFSYCHNGRYKNISHVAICVGNGKVVEAKNERAGVVYGDISLPEGIVTICRP